jgi:hypothetical protein
VCSFGACWSRRTKPSGEFFGVTVRRSKSFAIIFSGYLFQHALVEGGDATFHLPGIQAGVGPGHRYARDVDAGKDVRILPWQ